MFFCFLLSPSIMDYGGCTAPPLEPPSGRAAPLAIPFSSLCPQDSFLFFLTNLAPPPAYCTNCIRTDSSLWPPGWFFYLLLFWPGIFHPFYVPRAGSFFLISLPPSSRVRFQDVWLVAWLILTLILFSAFFYIMLFLPWGRSFPAHYQLLLGSGGFPAVNFKKELLSALPIAFFVLWVSSSCLGNDSPPMWSF